MGRSKVMGKAVAELTREEFIAERGRCRLMAQLYANMISGKGARKRLWEIEKRILREGVG
jgi:hypothetical protein